MKYVIETDLEGGELVEGQLEELCHIRGPTCHGCLDVQIDSKDVQFHEVHRKTVEGNGGNPTFREESVKNNRIRDKFTM